MPTPRYHDEGVLQMFSRGSSLDTAEGYLQPSKCWMETPKRRPKERTQALWSRLCKTAMGIAGDLEHVTSRYPPSPPFHLLSFLLLPFDLRFFLSNLQFLGKVLHAVLGVSVNHFYFIFSCSLCQGLPISLCQCVSSNPFFSFSMEHKIFPEMSPVSRSLYSDPQKRPDPLSTRSVCPHLSLIQSSAQGGQQQTSRGWLL